MARQLTWVPPDGSPEIILNDPSAGYAVKAAGTRGLSSPPYRLTAETYAGIPGTTLQAIQADQREVSLGLQVEGATVAEFRARWRALIRAMRPMAGDGVLAVADESGTRRSLACRYVSGLEGDAEAEFPGRIGRAVLKLVAFDPWFYGDEQEVSFSLGAPTSFFTPGVGFPLTLSSSSVQGSFAIDLSDSDSPTPVTWTITGPGTALTLTNVTTGQVITVTATLTSGQTMIIDTRPGYQSVRRGDGTNLMGSVTSDPALWSLIEDQNEITASMTGATAASRIEASFQPRYAGA
jgi:hypothetical protein